MARTSEAAVRAILPTVTALTSAQIVAAIAAATLIIDQAADSCAANLPIELLTQAETYLAAHFAAATEQTLSLSSEKSACTGSSATYGFVFGEGIKGSPFGQMANTLTMGCLAEFDKTPVNIHVLGSDE